MNIKGNIKYISIGTIVFLLIYMFIAAIPMGSDIYFVPTWTRDISADIPPDPASFAKTEGRSFILGDRFGYFTDDGTILSSSRTDKRISISNAGWTVYPEEARNTALFKPDGSARLTITASGFVHLDQDRTYLFLPGGDGVSQYGADGKALWTREHTAPITAFNSSPEGTIIGYADGLLTCMGNDEKEVFSFSPGGSDHPIIFGAALSQDGRLAACITGIDKQRIVLIKITDGQYKIIHHAYLESDLRHQTLVEFEDTGRFAFFETASGLGIIDCQKMTVDQMPIDGRLIAVGTSPVKSLFVTLSKNGNRFTLSAIERPNHLVASTRFTAENAFLIQNENALFLGSDDRISRIDIGGIE